MAPKQNYYNNNIEKISFLLYTGHGGEQYCLYPGQNAPAAGGDTALPYSDRLL